MHKLPSGSGCLYARYHLCHNEKVYSAIAKGIELVGGIESIIDKNERILVKPNLLSASDPSKIITTNPSVFEGVLRYLRDKNYENIKYGDSPAGVYKMENVVNVTKLKDRADKYNVELGDFEHFEVVDYPEGKVAKKFPLCKGIIDANAIISVSKMKTHALENITGAIKNQYGCIYSNKKALGHAKYPSSESFALLVSSK